MEFDPVLYSLLLFQLLSIPYSSFHSQIQRDDIGTHAVCLCVMPVPQFKHIQSFVPEDPIGRRKTNAGSIEITVEVGQVVITCIILFRRRMRVNGFKIIYCRLGIIPVKRCNGDKG